MKQRLIDANALHYRMGVNQDDKQIFYVTGEDIDAAPTIDPENLRPRGHWEKETRIAGFAELRWRKKQMKPKKMIALAALIFALCGCGTSAAASEQDSWDNDFRMDWIADEGSFEVYQDRETGVQYIVFWRSYGFGITPRYNADGTLYQGGAHE